MRFRGPRLQCLGLSRWRTVRFVVRPEPLAVMPWGAFPLQPRQSGYIAYRAPAYPYARDNGIVALARNQCVNYGLALGGGQGLPCDSR